MGTPTPRSMRLAGLALVALLFALALLARPHESDPTPAEQAAIDRADAQVADRELAKHPMALVMAPASVAESAACFRQTGFTIVRRTGTSLVVERHDAPRSAIRFFPPGPAALSNLPSTPPGQPQWSATNNVRFRLGRDWYLGTTEATRRTFFHCLNAD